SEILGGLVIQSYREDIEYGQQEEEILQFVARQIALVFKSKQAELALIDANADLEKRVSERTQELYLANSALTAEVQERKRSQQVQAALFQITELVSTADSLQGLFYGVHQIIKRLMFAENEYIALLSEKRDLIEFPYYVDEVEPHPTNRKYGDAQVKKGFTEKVLISGESLLFCKGQSIQGFEGNTKCESWLGVPLKDRYQVFGVLAIQSYQPDIVYTRDEQLILLTIGQQVATAILRKKDAESLRIAHETLERRVKERTSELEQTIEKRKLIEERLAYESLHDSLTGLPNRQQLSNALNQLIRKNSILENEILALLFLDLDRFKIINDSLGHHIGDLFLIEVAKRLQHCIRDADLVARLGGDEFCILMPSIKSDTIALRLCARLLKELKKPFEVAGHSLITSASIGVRLGSSKDISAELIMSDADAAMYQAKHLGKNQYCLFDSNIKKLVTNRMKMERDLRDAVANNELYLVYQPIIDMVKNIPVGFEALVRWEHPENGFVSPEEFIPVAEETGIIVEIGEAVVDLACKTLARLKLHDKMSPMYVNVNVSSVQILSRTLDDFIRRKLAHYDISTENLNIEITESILIEDYKAALNFVREVKAMGMKVYLDDFGTGYSSLSYLHKFPFDAIKLDRSFIKAINTAQDNSALVESIAVFARNLGIHIVAEGVENEMQLSAIKNMGYEVAQGYYFAKPIKADLITDFVESW
ncbi:MAG: EAL domain-containing protein, partial [Kangiellaceae bacterium]|nr:EAL domain-containing protein [Kangiellaceae bacterium]